jgi:hypothetical protein
MEENMGNGDEDKGPEKDTAIGARYLWSGVS